MLVFVAQVSCVYPLKAIVIMSSASRDAVRTNVNKQNKTNKKVVLGSLFIIKGDGGGGGFTNQTNEGCDI